MKTSYLNLGALPQGIVRQILEAAISEAVNNMSVAEVENLVKAPLVEFTMDTPLALAA